MSSRADYLDLSSRERQIVEALFRCGKATVSEIQKQLPDPPSSSAVRTMLARLEEKGYVGHVMERRRNVYSAALSVDRARRSAVKRMMGTFFEGSPLKTVATILEQADAKLTDEDLEELRRLIERARGRGR